MYLQVIVTRRSGWRVGCIPYLQKPGNKREDGSLTHVLGLWVNTGAVGGESTVWRLTHLPFLGEGYLSLNCTFLIFTHFCKSSAFQVLCYQSKQTCHVVPIPWPSAHTTTCSDLIKSSSTQRSTLFRSGFLGIWLAQLHRVSVQTDLSCSVTILKLLVIFKLRVSHFHFTWGPAIFITSLITHFCHWSIISLWFVVISA